MLIKNTSIMLFELYLRNRDFFYVLFEQNDYIYKIKETAQILLVNYKNMYAIVIFKHKIM